MSSPATVPKRGARIIAGTPRSVAGDPRGQYAGSAHREARLAPGLKPPDQVGRAFDPELLERGRGEARLVALVAHHDDLTGRVGDGRIPPLGRRICTPLQHVAGHQVRAGHHTITGPLAR